MEESHRRPDSNSSGEKWRKYGDLGIFPNKINTGTSTTIDSYRPSSSSSSSASPVRRTLDRAIPQPIDSYRPSAAPIMHLTSSSNLVLGRSTAVNDPASVKSETMSKSSSSIYIPNRSTSLSNSAQHQHRQTVSNSTAISATTTSYLPQEKYMEGKAKSLGIRRDFFQYLQRKRVRIPTFQTA